MKIHPRDPEHQQHETRSSNEHATSNPDRAPQGASRPPGHSEAKSGRTQSSEDSGESSPRMPHEHDESSDSHNEPGIRPVIRKAHDDVVRGVVDTDRGTPSDQAYQRQKRGG
jgi:hypothetical protein